MPYLPTQLLRIYREFKAIAPQDHYGIIRFYEREEAAIGLLDIEAYFDCMLTYAGALYETGDYGRYGVMADQLLAYMLEHRIAHWGGEDLFAPILLRKAHALMLLQEYPQAGHVLRELIKINPEDRAAREMYFQVLSARRPVWMPKVRAVAGLFILCAALIAAVEIFLIQPFYNALADYTRVGFIGLFSTGLLLAGISGALHHWRCKLAVRNFVIFARGRKGGV